MLFIKTPSKTRRPVETIMVILGTNEHCDGSKDDEMLIFRELYIAVGKVGDL